ncbi:2-oxoglutarate-dependent dioxygenase DAO-like [Phalaenopsis equestris]|uniref:2-oxoglutarate-dependent dioxygenase DAO-like n=1 Tax=Phalaenopsis equestris TaxID=78828 RepID=UPI0009E60CC9|nr:2-oxoglutarate-dependent dioxygenase DAO-like [Phalaenopsis equestris]XP_020572990.1 2-oxoglutarate-dependent dioxygenase DAO-like [Phalaenopsis equestris]XP_020572991.1 2-oxoglutarate-dependent dioxygenase DAO-like [Phalaenopsis equestris]
METAKISVPVIDLANCFVQAGKQKLAAAITEMGCFRVINHGFPAALAAEMRAIVPSLMEHRRNTEVSAGSGYMAPNQYSQIAPLQESLGIYNAASSEEVHSFCSLMHVSPQQRETISEYASKLHDLIVDIASKVTDCLGVEGFSFQEWPCRLGLNRYNFTEETIGSIGAPIHTDSSFLTIVQEEESIGGFEIADAAGNFVAIDPVPGTFWVNIGDMGKVWSNGRLQNVKHRVICKKASQRFSIVLFMFPPENSMVEPQAAFIDSKHKRLYGTIDLPEYRKLRLSSKLTAGELLSHYSLE